jgi:hypothetical protein
MSQQRPQATLTAAKLLTPVEQQWWGSMGCWAQGFKVRAQLLKSGRLDC